MISLFFVGEIRKVIGLKPYKGYLIDLDGTMYRGNEEIKGAKEFIAHLNRMDIPYLFITNNSTLTREDVVEKLARFQIETTKNNVLTTAVATANYIKGRKDDATCYVIGENGLKEACKTAGITFSNTVCDFVVIGLDREITYEKLASASLLIRKGAQFISTNRDAAIPTEKGLLPGNGAITAAVATSTKTTPLFIGKPEKIIMDEALRLLKLRKNEVLMIGDNYETDICAGIKSDIDTLMVLTGFTTAEDLLYVKKQPTYVMADLYDYLNE